MSDTTTTTPEETPEPTAEETPETTPETLPAVPEESEEEIEETPETESTETDFTALFSEKDDAEYEESEEFDPDARGRAAISLTRQLASMSYGSTELVYQLALAIALARSVLLPRKQTSPDWAGVSWAAREFTRLTVTVPARATFTESFKAQGYEGEALKALVESETQALVGRVAKRVQRVTVPELIERHARTDQSIAEKDSEGKFTLRAPETEEEIKRAVTDQYHGAMTSSGKKMLAPGEKRERENTADTSKQENPVEELKAGTAQIAAALPKFGQAKTAKFVLSVLGPWLVTLRSSEAFDGSGTDRTETIALLDQIAALASVESTRLAGETPLTEEELEAHNSAVNAAASLDLS